MQEIVVKYHMFQAAKLKRLNDELKKQRDLHLNTSISITVMNNTPEKGEFETTIDYRQRRKNYFDSIEKPFKDKIEILGEKINKEIERQSQEVEKIKRIRKSCYKIEYNADEKRVYVIIDPVLSHKRTDEWSNWYDKGGFGFQFGLKGKLSISRAKEIIPKLRQGHKDVYIAGRFTPHKGAVYSERGISEVTGLSGRSPQDTHIFYIPKKEIFPLTFSHGSTFL